MTAAGAAGFDEQDGDGGQSSEGIEPAEAEKEAQYEAGEGDSGQVSAGGRLDGVSAERGIAEPVCRCSLTACKHRHE